MVINGCETLLKVRYVCWIHAAGNLYQVCVFTGEDLKQRRLCFNFNRQGPEVARNNKNHKKPVLINYFSVLLLKFVNFPIYTMSISDIHSPNSSFTRIMPEEDFLSAARICCDKKGRLATFPQYALLCSHGTNRLILLSQAVERVGGPFYVSGNVLEAIGQVLTPRCSNQRRLFQNLHRKWQEHREQSSQIDNDCVKNKKYKFYKV